MIEQDQSNSLIIAATNHPEILDYALFRRFDDVIEYGLPNQEQIQAVLKTRLVNFSKSIKSWDKLTTVASGLSYAELVRAADDAIKDAIIHDRVDVDARDVAKHLEERKAFHGKQRL
ncbi:proteasome-activating nucleotidase [compost metagenome]